MDRERKPVLIAGESWITVMTHIKGFDTFTTTQYGEGVQWIRAAIEGAGFAVKHMPNHDVGTQFPLSPEELDEYSVVILSDVGSNTLLLHPRTFHGHEVLPNRVESIAQYVKRGGGLAMVGGYFSFQGLDAKANYRSTALHDVLPVVLQAADDRVEVPQGAYPEVVDGQHPVTKGLPERWPVVLGYNRFSARPEADILMKCGSDDFLVVGDYGKGRTLAFATDCGPHWGSPALVESEAYVRFWASAVRWLTHEL